MVEKSLPGPFGCSADAFPPAQYYWQFEASPSAVATVAAMPLMRTSNASITEGPLRHFRHPVGRKQVSGITYYYLAISTYYHMLCPLQTGSG